MISRQSLAQAEQTCTCSDVATGRPAPGRLLQNAQRTVTPFVTSARKGSAGLALSVRSAAATQVSQM